MKARYKTNPPAFTDEHSTRLHGAMLFKLAIVVTFLSESRIIAPQLNIVGIDGHGLRGFLAWMFKDVWQGCILRISIFAQQIGNQQTIQKKTPLVNSTLIHKLNNPRNLCNWGVIRDNPRFRQCDSDS